MRHTCLLILLLILPTTSYGAKDSKSVEGVAKITDMPDLENSSISDLNITTANSSSTGTWKTNPLNTSITSKLRNLMVNLLKLPVKKFRRVISPSTTLSGNSSGSWSSLGNPLVNPLRNDSNTKIPGFFRIIRQADKNCTGSECGLGDKTKSYMKDYLNVNEAQYLTLFGFIILGMCMGLLLAKFLGDED